MVTLTLPGSWEAVTPTAAAATAVFKRFEQRWRHRWGEPLRCIWKREFQRRGAPHWHLWLCPPAGHDEFAGWLSEAWTDCLHIADPWERFLSSRAGTGVDYAAGAGAHDPKRLALYFLKESLGGEGKAYQNTPPALWAGESVGRYWGVRGLDSVTADVPLSTAEGQAVWRVLRHLRGHERTARRVLRCRRDHAHGRRCFRVQRRRAVAPAAAGWVVANDGPALAEALARFLATSGPDAQSVPLGDLFADPRSVEAPGPDQLAQLVSL
jgi:hypothetical protein